MTHTTSQLDLFGAPKSSPRPAMKIVATRAPNPGQWVRGYGGNIGIKYSYAGGFECIARGSNWVTRPGRTVRVLILDMFVSDDVPDGGYIAIGLDNSKHIESVKLQAVWGIRDVVTRLNTPADISLSKPFQMRTDAMRAAWSAAERLGAPPRPSAWDDYGAEPKTEADWAAMEDEHEAAEAMRSGPK